MAHIPARRSPWRGSRLAALLVAISLVTALVNAQDAERHGIFLDTIDVNVVNLEVMVFDKEGNPVTGLTRDDFQVYEDGKPIEVTNFYAVENGLRLLAQGDETEPPSPVAEDGEENSPEQHRYVILFVDNGNIAANHRKRVFDDLYGLLDRLIAAADRVMVMSQDDDVTIEQPFTTDRVLLESAIRTLERQVGRGAMRATQPRIIQQNIERGQAPPDAVDPLVVGADPLGGGGPLQRPTFDVDAGRTFAEVSSYAQVTQEETRRTMVALGRFIDSLAGLPGRKAVIYVSDGLELKPGEFLFRVWDYKYSSIAAQEVGVSNIETEIERYALDEPFRDLVASANANRVSFYTVQGGDTQIYSISAESRSMVAESLARTADGERQSSLRTLAGATGGVPLLNQASLDNLVSQMETDLSTYYSLGYPSPHRGDGKYHRVKVVVQREDLRVRYLEGYQDKSSDDRMNDQTLASLLLDVGDNPLGIQLEVGEAERDGKDGGKKGGGKGFLVPLLVKVPLGRLVLLPQEDEHLGRVSIFVAVRDGKGRLSNPQKIDLPVRIPNDKLLEALTQSAGWATRLLMRPGEQKIAVGVRDELGAVASTVNLNLDVGG